MTPTLDDFDYPLPPECIAQAPLAERSASRLLVMRGNALANRGFVDLPGLLDPGDLLVMNDTRVLHARLMGHKSSGGQVEVLVERITGDDTVLAQVRASKSPKPGCLLRLEDGIDAEVLGREGEFYRLRFQGDAVDLIERHGRLPLPPYIERTAASADEERYQTVFAKERGSVAAPTAGLHFDAPLLERLRERGIGIAHVTLHVGAGTFQPVRVQDLSQHRMHTERYHVPQATAEAIIATRARGGRVVAVGTTSLRTLESAAQEDGQVKVGAGETALFITPGYRFRVVDRLVTNFHLPKSTLLMLVSAFGGMEAIRAAYRHAIDNGYRFFSYGDAMLIERQDEI
ncbi:MAG: tRNA preQ1(34) S-adenosylmethionine ribosyltransferase-isomerase QueA [Rhodocyclaceae bacterium]|jgi:S-adenosylmethionine:tRNA ribosyltransferase-isomerase|nr:tRNA preQ1(34) S-adenosylmethionine ribosyltransferase-isomerase QueA [Rhodocyclaceae bacterium]